LRSRNLILGAAFLCAAAGAARGESLQSCAAITTSDQRLKCFDQLASEAVPTTPIATQSKWIVQTKTSPVDDTTNVYVELSGENGILDQYGQKSSITLELTCRENVTAAFFIFGGYFMSDLEGRGTVTYRIDKQAAQNKNFTVSTDNKALGLWSGGTAIPFIKSLLDGQRLYVEATPFSDNAVSDFLPISGLKDAISPLRKSCGW